MFLMVPYAIVAASSLAKAIKVSRFVGQTGLPNLTQKRMNCLMLLLWFLLVPSAYIRDWDSLALVKRTLKWSLVAVSRISSSISGEVGGEDGGGSGGGDGKGEGPPVHGGNLLGLRL